MALLAADGTVITMNSCAQRLSRHAGVGPVGRSCAVFYPSASRAASDGSRAVEEITRALLLSADPTEVLDMVTRYARELTGAARTWLATRRGLSLVVLAASGTVHGPPVGATWPRDEAVVAKVILTAQPAYLADLAASCPGLPNLEALGAGLLVPLVAGSAVTGVLFAAAATGACHFGSGELDVLQTFAHLAELVLAHDEMQRLLRGQQVNDDRERIARDLHDHVIQQLFATGLALESAAMRSTEPTVRRRVVDAVDRLDATIRQIRLTIFDLHQLDPQAPDSTRTRIRTVVREAGRALNFEPGLLLDGPIDSVIEPGSREHLLAALREMLSNVVRHADASVATVSLHVGDEIQLRVTDNGNGPPTGASAGSGVGNLRGRASDLGGQFTLENAVGGGALATWTIPVPPPRLGPDQGEPSSPARALLA